MNDNIITNNSNKKTERKNKTNLVVTWPTLDEYFTIKTLSQINPDFVNITLRVRLNKAVTEEPKTVQVIGQKNTHKGRPELVFAMKPIKQTTLDKAKADGITMDTPKNVSVNVLNV